MSYSTIGVNFDGSTDYNLRGGDLTGNGDTKLWCGSFWFKRGAAGVTHRIYSNTNSRTRIGFPGNNKLEFIAKNTLNATILDVESSAIADTASWHHCLYSFDMAGSAFLYIDDVSDLATTTTYVDDTIEVTRPEHAIGALTDGANKYNGDLADFWLEYGATFTFSTESNRRKFVTADVKLVDLGADGSTPNSTAPIVYLRGPAADFDTNLGGGGNFVEQGSMADSATNPPSVGVGILQHPGMSGGMREMLGGMRG